MSLSRILTSAIIATALGTSLTACNEKTATAPKLDAETSEALGDMQRIMEGDNVTFGDLMKMGKMATDPENQKKIVCGALTAGAQMSAMAQVSGMDADMDDDEVFLAYLTQMAAEILPTIEDKEVSTTSVQAAMAPVFNECIKYSMDVITGSKPFKKGKY
ncbi:MAG: hypothetical protein V3U82_09380 [Robiginitomaculum sp.]